MCGSTLFHVLRKHNISLYAFVSTNAVLVKKKGRGIFAILRPFPVGRGFIFSYCFMEDTPSGEILYLFILSFDKLFHCGGNALCRKEKVFLGGLSRQTDAERGVGIAIGQTESGEHVIRTFFVRSTG